MSNGIENMYEYVSHKWINYHSVKYGQRVYVYCRWYLLCSDTHGGSGIARGKYREICHGNIGIYTVLYTHMHAWEIH